MGSLCPRHAGVVWRDVRGPVIRQRALNNHTCRCQYYGHKTINHIPGFTFRKSRHYGRTTSYLVFSMSSGYCNGVSLILPLLQSSCSVMRDASQETATSTIGVVTPGSQRTHMPVYLDFLQNMLSLVMEDIPLAKRRDLWFQHNGALAHFCRDVREHLNNTYRGRWIGQGGQGDLLHGHHDHPI
ncbi:hypothetical protein PR048_001824 [Dryococelus australis]|uniref:Transposase n=1 Tax=Dryococelus australis TaxID=614101 RepID=A0ABQ9IIF2_9NEOP|nr:hypothetical protein PR048_001824 [Dryococelus australis]